MGRHVAISFHRKFLIENTSKCLEK